MSDARALLSVKDLEAWYGELHILHGVTFDVQPGEVVTLLGRNGVGKTTTLKAIMGIIEQRTGSVRFEGKELIGLPSDAIARCGIAFCPEERGIFASLDVKENLLLPPQVRPGGLDLDRIFELFPNLRERLRSQGTKLSGGVNTVLPEAAAEFLRNVNAEKAVGAVRQAKPRFRKRSPRCGKGSARQPKEEARTALLRLTHLAAQHILIQRPEFSSGVQPPAPEDNSQTRHHRNREEDTQNSGHFAARHHAENRCQGMQFLCFVP